MEFNVNYFFHVIYTVNYVTKQGNSTLTSVKNYLLLLLVLPGNFLLEISFLIAFYFALQIVLYVFFPIAVFFYFNLPESYDDFMSQKKVCKF